MSIVAIDIGSSRIKVVLATWDGQSLEVRDAITPRQTREAGERSYPPDAVCDVIEHLIAEVVASQRSAPVDTLAFSCLGTAMAPVDADDRPLGPALAPADTRPQAGPWRVGAIGIDADALSCRTGSDPSVPSFLSHALWWQAEHPDVMELTHRFRSLRGYALARLCGADVEDHSWASRTMLVDLEADDWSPDILAAASLSSEWFPPLVPATTALAVRADAVERLGLAPGARAIVGAMDNCCSLFGAAGPGRSGLVNIVGTYEHMAGAATLGEVREVAARSGAIVHTYLLPDQYITMTRVPIGELLALATAHAGRSLDVLLEDISATPAGRPLALDVAAVHAAMSDGRSSREVLQDLVEASARVLARLADAWAELGRPSEPIAVVGGGSRHEAVLCLKATVLDRRLVTLARDESAALGALRLAAMAVEGTTADEACTLFDNAIVQTIRPGACPDGDPITGVTTT